MSKGRSKRKAQDIEDLSANHVVFHNPSVKRVQYTVTSDASTSQTTSILGRMPIIPPTKPTVAPPVPEISKPVEKPSTTRNAQLLEDFGEHFELLGSLLLDYEADELNGHPCACGRDGMIASTQCHDCTGYALSCKPCFVDAHIRNPFHWAEVWDSLQGFFVRHDISKLDHIIQLGHKGGPCSSPVGHRMFTVVDANGIHSSRLAFCGCQEQPPNKIKQLMRSRLFPATTRDPHTAFTVNMLKQFQLHNLESKKAAYDYLGAIRRLSDNSFTADVPNPYAAFLCVVRVFNFLTLKKRTGQFHGIDSILSHRPSGNLLVWCPACPEPGFNSDPNCPKTPHDLRYDCILGLGTHLNQSQRTLDGNFQCNQFNKNTDPNDISLCAGKGYFPPDSEYKKYLAGIPVSKEKSTCNYLNAVNKQDKKKFKNMAVTGTVNCQCSHVCVLSCVDLYHGERFANTDKALAMELKQHKPSDSFQVKWRFEVDDVDEVTTYDIACEYFINLEARIQTSFPELVPFIKRMRWGVPALHVQGHQESCTYRFGTAYMECVGHFHGESAEQYWPEANQLGPHVRQMNNGHRQHTMINHHGDWNYKKTMGMAVSLADDIQEARAKYIEKRNHFIGLSASFSDRVESWQKMPRQSSKSGKEIPSVYRHNTTKVPSQQAIYQKMLNDEKMFASSMVARNKVARFLDEGLKIQEFQRKIRNLSAVTEDHDLASRRKEITLRTSKIQNRIAEWRKTQKQLMPRVGDKVVAQALIATPVQNEKLFLPSDFPSEVERQELDLVSLAVEEGRWREGQAFDCLRSIQNIVKTLTALRNRKIKNERYQKQNSRAGDNIEDTVNRRNEQMEAYEAARQGLIALNMGSNFPHLTEPDLYMKSVQQKRRISSLTAQDSAGDSLFSGTQMDKRKSGPRVRKEPKNQPKPVADKRPEGWLWQLGKLSKMTSAEMDEWSSEGDRVQWFRAEAEMQRWQEQGEQKLGEVLRTNRSFLKMQQTWKKLACRSPLAGHQAYANQKAAMYRERAAAAQKLLTSLGYGDLLGENANLIQRVRLDREREAQLVRDSLAI
ncbi:hypothetical protein B0H17DRAFT_1163665 [Mycena rosella]|uniref:CxC2-like cysteine cluster KDZ transposase-associated domain-containing protein n=1 Tax=Mycena rosella TaxID=1033263 RepID=A0AAD7G2E2_MYCRO|nr:hypothetical protein B0H17DRAFT_1163665 [Mycena rosella]